MKMQADILTDRNGTSAAGSEPVLDVAGLNLSLRIDSHVVPIVTDISFAIAPGEAVALVGESGCGKSITASAVIGLPPENAIVTGAIRLNGSEIGNLPTRQRRRLCGSEIGFIFQEPMTALHPTLSIGHQLTDTLRTNLGLSKKAAMDRAAELLDRVGIPRPRDILAGYVHQLSGGMRQRVMIAMAISCDPSLVIADEPTTALDVTIQAQVLDLLEDMRTELNLAMLFITHDLEVVSDFCERAVIMYAGDVVETGTSGTVVDSPVHPYTRGLLDAVPAKDGSTEKLTPIPGTVPQIGDWPTGCRFAPRCPYAGEKCATRPALETTKRGLVRCWYPLEEMIR